MEQQPNSHESNSLTIQDIYDAKLALRDALDENHPDLRLYLGVCIADQEYKVQIRVVDESQKELAAELAERYIPGVPVSVEDHEDVTPAWGEEKVIVHSPGMISVRGYEGPPTEESREMLRNSHLYQTMVNTFGADVADELIEK